MSEKNESPVAATPVPSEPTPAEPAPAQEKTKPAGVTVGQRMVMVDGKLVPMAEKDQTPIPANHRE